jgi:predicted AAA+ superfamily ATPase
MSISELTEHNPWWLDRTAIDKDRLISEYDSASFKWDPRLEKTIEWDADVIYVLRGPRQVGKSTLLKLKIRDFMRTGTQPRRVFYWPCDLVGGPEKLAAVVTSYLDLARRDEVNRLYIVLDEISSVRDWQKGIKSLYDSGRLRNCTIILTGSHSIDLRKASETLARRRGEIHKLKDQLPDKVLLPMKFSEYVDERSETIRNFVLDLDLLRRERRHAIWSEICKGSLPREIKELEVVAKGVQQLFDEYLITGGIPKTIDTYLRTGTISRDLYEGYVDLLVRDIARWNGNEIILRQIVRRLVDTLATPVTLNSLREDTDVSSHHTTGTYLDFLRDSFVVTTIHKLDKNKDGPVFRNSRKIHFVDPFLFHALRAWALGRDPYRDCLNFLSESERISKLVECVVADHAVRLLFGYQPSAQFDYTNHLFHWENKKRQLDFVMRMDAGYLPIEVKYQNTIKSSDAQPIADFQKGGKSTSGLLLTKDTLAAKRSYLEIPVSLCLMLI